MSPRITRATARAALKCSTESTRDDEDDNMTEASASHRDNGYFSDSGSEYDGADDSSSDEYVDMLDNGVEEKSSDKDIEMPDDPDLRHENLIHDMEPLYRPSQPPLNLPALGDNPDEDAELPSQSSPLSVGSSALGNDPDDHLAHQNRRKAGEGSTSRRTVPSQGDSTKKQKEAAPRDDEESKSDYEYDLFDDYAEEPLVDSEGLSREQLFDLHRQRVSESRRDARSVLPRYPTKVELRRGVQPPILPDGMRFCGSSCRYARPLSEFERKPARGKVYYVKNCIECAQDAREYAAHKVGLLQDATAKNPTKKLCVGPCNQLKPLEAFDRRANGKVINKTCSECIASRRKSRAKAKTTATEKLAKQNETADATSPDLKLCKYCPYAQPLAEFVRTRRGKNDGKPYEQDSCNTCARTSALSKKRRRSEGTQQASMANDGTPGAMKFCRANIHLMPVSEFMRWGVDHKKSGGSIYKEWENCNSCTEIKRQKVGANVYRGPPPDETHPETRVG
ncbi:hypothetical protein J4E80_010020 [Alternaria sp. BMP 0032]|nr:hypothetical protein J4E80_010020 [Alternaria sp. BMP 0032]